MLTSCGSVHFLTQTKTVPRRYSVNYNHPNVLSERSEMNRKAWVIYSDRAGNVTTARPRGSLPLSCIVNENKSDNMSSTKFFPKSFHDVKLGYHETEMNECSPGYPEELFSTNKIAINVPRKIIFHLDNLQPIIPVCVLYVVSVKRGLKYDGLSKKFIFMANTKDTTNEYTAEVYDNDPNLQHEHPEPDPFAEELENERRKKIIEAQRYSDDELEESTDWGRYMNINLLDYINLPIESGKYEVWMSFYGLESNHCFVEIIAR